MPLSQIIKDNPKPRNLKKAILAHREEILSEILQTTKYSINFNSEDCKTNDFSVGFGEPFFGYAAHNEEEAIQLMSENKPVVLFYPQGIDESSYQITLDIKCFVVPLLDIFSAHNSSLSGNTFLFLATDYAKAKKEMV
ncbi:MAG TPA: hypothetical protein DIV86_05150, partial [Alphaproteobacteria bacterium]|nr:hypothetical protein [Alphaproteobacteria bacterium]